MSDHATSVPARIPRLIGVALAIAAIAHTLVIGLWASPDNAARDAVGEERLGRYVRPHFEQSWSVFAPVPRRVDESFSIRAGIADQDGSTRVTAWFDISADDQGRTTFEFNPPRMVRASRVLAAGLNAGLPQLNAAQQYLVESDFADPRDRAVEAAMLAPTVGTEAATRTEVTSFLRTEEMALRFATLYAKAKWGRGVEMVQIRIGRRPVPGYDEHRDFDSVPYDLRTLGWRRAISGGPEVQSGFRDWVRR